MLEINRNLLSFKIKEIWFAEQPYNIENCDSIFFKSCKNKVDVEGFTREEHSTLVIDITKDLDELRKDMSKGNCRKPINRALHAGITIKLNQNYKDFYSIYKSTKVKKGLYNIFLDSLYNYEFKITKQYGTLFTAEFNGEILSGHGYLGDQNTMVSYVIGSKRFEGDKEYRTMVGNASKLIIWEAIKYAKGKDLKEFDLGGYSLTAEKGSERYGINKFKESFGGELITKYFYQRDYSKILKLIRDVYNKI